MQKQGKWVGGKTPLGYIKNSNDKNKLIIYEPEAQIVRTIFNMASNGKQVGTIRDYLNSNNIPTANKSRYNKETFWENKTVKNILKNKAYIGTTVQNKRSRISYKNRKIRTNSEEKWIQDKEVDLYFNFKQLNNLKEFNYKKIYFAEKTLSSVDYFKLILNKLYDFLKDTFENKEKQRKICEILVDDFEEWLTSYYNFERCKSDIKEYSQAIIYYISGMTDKYAVQMYNKIISF